MAERGLGEGEVMRVESKKDEEALEKGRKLGRKRTFTT
jgi:hypothetical protein